LVEVRENIHSNSTRRLSINMLLRHLSGSGPTFTSRRTSQEQNSAAWGRSCNSQFINGTVHPKIGYEGLPMCDPVGGRCWSLLLFAAVAALLSSRYIYSQTSSTGALAGVTLDPYDAVLPQVVFTSPRWMGTKQWLPPLTRMDGSGSSYFPLGRMRCR
jgi:hypothetical protein